jgi:Mg-chelatase subunit ChlD
LTFTSPLLLLFLLLLLPLFAWLGWPAPGLARRRESISLALRLVIVLCLILALAGLQIVQGGNNLVVVFLVDVSDSMPKQALAAEMGYVRSAIQSMGADDQSAVVLFGTDALVERSMSAARELGAISSTPVTNQTDLAGAMRLGMALFPSSAARRMMILSDGDQTSGDALAAAQFAAASGIQIISLPFIKQPGSEVLVSAVDAPSRLLPGEKFDLDVSIQAAEAVQAVVRVLAGDKVIYEQPHDLHRGIQTFSLPLTAGSTPGFVNYQVQIAPQKDGFYQNNRLDAFSQVEGPPRVLVVAPPTGEIQPNGQPRPDETSALLAALKSADFSLEVATPAQMPASLPGLAQYNSVVLVDVPASALSPGQMEDLQIYVRDLGGGLVAVGGPTSYGVGGYYQTPLEATLPVDMQIKDEKRRPSLGIVFIIDHSGSMGETSGGVEKLELAKEAAARSVQMLFPNDRVGVIAFDDTASWVVPMTALSDPTAVRNAIGSIQVGGGTDILGAVQAMAKVLPGDPAKVKHVILLTDGGADPTGIPELVKKLNTENGITLSTVAVGQDAAPFLKDLAALGGGRYHFTADAGSIPSIFTEETTLATRAYIVEEPFFPKLVNASPILAGIDATPRIYGYVATSAKDLAQVILKSEKDDPILATWQYGLGRSAAFTSDATGRWGRDWVPWQGFAAFWAQTVRYTLGDSSNTALEMSVTLDGKGKQAHLTLDARSRSGGFLNGYQVQANVVSPGGETQSVALRQVAPGRYETYFDPKEQGVYLVRFDGKPESGGSGQSFAQTDGWTLSYSPEYRRIESDPDLLLRLAALTGGKAASAKPADVFLHNLQATSASRPVWPWLLLLTALLLPFDVASRRLILTRQDWVRLAEALKAQLQPRKRKAAPVAQSAQMTALFQAKGRARPPAETVLPPQPTPKASAQTPPVEAPRPVPPQPKADAPATPSAPGSTAASLLARKKNLRRKK